MATPFMFHRLESESPVMAFSIAYSRSELEACLSSSSLTKTASLPLNDAHFYVLGVVRNIEELGLTEDLQIDIRGFTILETQLHNNVTDGECFTVEFSLAEKLSRTTTDLDRHV